MPTARPNNFSQGRLAGIPLVSDRDLHASWDAAATAPLNGAPGPATAPTPTVAWEDPQALDPNRGAPPTVRARVFLVSWSNPHPEVPLTSLDFAAEGDDLSVLFRLAITPEPWDVAAP